MDVTIEFNEAAFIHYVSKEDIRCAFDNARYDGSIDANTINVFHAMKCRKNFFHLIKTRGENNG